MFTGDGHWEGAEERSLVIEIVVPQSGRDEAIKSVAKRIGHSDGSYSESEDSNRSAPR